MTAKKYKILRDQTMEHEGRTLYRILRLLTDEVGGWIEGPHNLSQDGACWVSDNAMVYGEAKVSDGAFVHGNAKVSGNAKICGGSHVHSNARVYGDARVTEHSIVGGDSEVFGNASVGGHSMVFGNARVYGDATLDGFACVSDTSIVRGSAHVGKGCWLRGGMEATMPVLSKEIPVGGLAVASDEHICVGITVRTLEQWEASLEEFIEEESFHFDDDDDPDDADPDDETQQEVAPNSDDGVIIPRKHRGAVGYKEGERQRRLTDLGVSLYRNAILELIAERRAHGLKKGVTHARRS